MGVVIPMPVRERLSRTLDPPLIAVFTAHEWEIFHPDGTTATDQYEHMRRGRCALCGDLLGEDTVIIVDAQGILSIFCDMDCLVDGHAIAFLEGILSTMVEGIGQKEQEE